MIRRIAFISCLLAPFAANAQTAGACTAATLSGAYSLTLSGRNVSSTVVITSVFQAVGEITFDGVGSATAAVFANTNQGPLVQETLTGTYAIPSNCVGTLTLAQVPTGGDPASYVLIPYNNGKNYVIAGEDATYTLSGSGGLQPASCLPSTFSGVYAFSGNGFSLASGAVTGVNNISGLLQFDGYSKVTGSWSIATNGAITEDTLSGTYVAPACSGGYATLTDSNGVQYQVPFSATSADGANAAIIGAASANMFSGTMHSTFANPGLSIVNSAGVSGGTPPGSLFSVYGSNLATGQAEAVKTPFPDTLATTSVTVNGEQVPLSYVNKTQINAQMPWDIAPGVATVVVTTGSTQSNAVATVVPATAVPGVFVYGSNEAVAQNLPSYTLNSPAAPAPVGSSIVVYLTGAGPVQGGSSVITGHVTPDADFPVTEPYSATIGGVPATVEFIGLTPELVGCYQANIVIPNIAKGNHNLIITIGGTASASTVISTN
ncbi:MAG: hypothetical protein ABSF22_08170 [Bryobacteraceae bacterium]